jgi:acyl-CoA synthetase (AMP-forming)/AMP-acid ligase II
MHGIEGTDALAADLIAYAKENLANYKIPRSVDFLDELPRLPTGKLYKRLLKDQYWPSQQKNRGPRR